MEIQDIENRDIKVSKTDKDFLIEVFQAKVAELDRENQRLINLFIDTTGNVDMVRDFIKTIEARAEKAEQRAFRAVVQEKANANLILSMRKQHKYDTEQLQNQIDTLKGVISDMLDSVDHQIIEMLDKGYSYGRIASEVGMSPGSISYRVKKLRAMGFLDAADKKAI